MKFSENENTIPVDREPPAAPVQAASSPQDHVQLWHMRVQEIGVPLRQDFELIYETP
jgi:hypothetical protein